MEAHPTSWIFATTLGLSPNSGDGVSLPTDDKELQEPGADYWSKVYNLFLADIIQDGDYSRCHVLNGGFEFLLGEAVSFYLTLKLGLTLLCRWFAIQEYMVCDLVRDGVILLISGHQTAF